MRELKDMAGLLLGFLPWLLFLFLAGHSLAGLERAIIISLIASLVFGYRGLLKGFILQWGTLFFFFACFVLVNLYEVIWVADYTGILTMAFLASVMWFSLAIGNPALQLARSDLPKEQWYDVGLIKGTRFITIALVYADDTRSRRVGFQEISDHNPANKLAGN